MKKFLIALLLIASITLGTACSGRNSDAVDGTEKSNTRSIAIKTDLSSPEKTIASFMTAFKAMDVEAINKTLSTAEYAKKYDLYAMADRLQAWTPTQMGMIQGDPLFEQINFYQKGNRQMLQLQMMIMSLLTNGKLDDLEKIQSYMQDDLAPALDALKEIDVKDMSQLEMVKMVNPVDKYVSGDDNDKATILEKNALKQAKAFGASNKTDRVALLKMGDRYLTAGFEVLQYGDDWLIDSFNSSIAGLNFYGIFEETTPEEFESEFIDKEE